MYEPTSPETEARIRNLCSDFLAGQWTTAKPDDVKIERLAGFLNRNFAVTLTSNECEKGGGPTKVMVHLYGSEIVDSSTNIKYNCEAAEAVITDELSQLGLAPKVIGVFPGGRIEEFIPSKNAELEDFENIELVAEMGQILAKIHSLTIPVKKTPDRIDRVLKNTLEMPILVDFGDAPESDKGEYFKFANFPLEAEVKEVSHIMSRIGSKVVFCHGDLNPNNILFRNETIENGQRIMTIDFELSSYYYRGFDLAYFFNQRSVIPKIISETEFDLVKLEDKNFERDKEILAQSYLKEWKQLHDNNLGPVDNFEHLRVEMDFGNLLVALLTICYMRYGSTVAKDPKAFKLHARIIDEYFLAKKVAFDTHKQIIGNLL